MITLDEQTAKEIREYLNSRPLQYSAEEEGDLLRWIDALTPEEPDGTSEEEE